MKIHKKEIRAIEEQDNSITYCQYCIKHNLKIALIERPDYTAHDKDLWRLCPNCKRIIPTYEIKREGRLEPTFEASDNPFDSQGGITGIGNKKKGRKKKDVESVEDDDIRRELEQGNDVEIF